MPVVHHRLGTSYGLPSLRWEPEADESGVAACQRDLDNRTKFLEVHMDLSCSTTARDRRYSGVPLRLPAIDVQVADVDATLCGALWVRVRQAEIRRVITLIHALGRNHGDQNGTRCIPLVFRRIELQRAYPWCPRKYSLALDYAR
jgi:hypothetical protein